MASDAATRTRKRAPATSAAPAPGYDTDYYGWVREQVALLQAGALDRIDAANIAEELSDMAKAEFRAWRSALRIVLVHMLKWDHQPSLRSRSWVVSIRSHRRMFKNILDENPSLKPRRAEALRMAYADAVDDAVLETGLPTRTFPADCPYTMDDVLGRSFVFEDESAS